METSCDTATEDDLLGKSEDNEQIPLYQMPSRTCPEFLQYRARAKMRADEDFKNEIKQILNNAEQETSKAIMCFYEREICRFNTEIKKRKRAKAAGTLNTKNCTTYLTNDIKLKVATEAPQRRESLNERFQLWQEKNAKITGEFCNSLLAMLKKQHLDPVLQLLQRKKGARLSFHEIIGKYNLIKDDYHKSAIGAKDEIEAVSFEFHPALMEEEEQYVSQLRLLKDYDERLTEQLAARAFQEQEKQKLEEQQRRLIQENSPVCVVIAGPYRKGKSYILSDAFDQPDVFLLGHKMEAETMRIWIWIALGKLKVCILSSRVVGSHWIKITWLYQFGKGGGAIIPVSSIFTVDHAMICKRGGFVIQRQNELRDLEADLLSIVYTDVEVEPVLKDITEEQLSRGSNRAQDARLDVRARGFLDPQSSAFFDVRVCHPNAESYKDREPQQIYRIHENDKKRLYLRRVLDVEHGSFTPLVSTTTGGMGMECIRYHSRLAELIAAKKGERYSQTISWIRAKTSFALLRFDSVIYSFPDALTKRKRVDVSRNFELALVYKQDRIKYNSRIFMSYSMPRQDEETLEYEDFVHWTVLSLKDFLALPGLKQTGLKNELVSGAFGAYELKVPIKSSHEEINKKLKKEYQNILKKHKIDTDPNTLINEAWQENVQEWPQIDDGILLSYILNVKAVDVEYIGSMYQYPPGMEQGDKERSYPKPKKKFKLESWSAYQTESEEEALAKVMQLSLMGEEKSLRKEEFQMQRSEETPDCKQPSREAPSSSSSSYQRQLRREEKIAAKTKQYIGILRQLKDFDEHAAREKAAEACRERERRRLEILTAYGGQRIECTGTCQQFIHYKGKVKEAPFTVTNVQGPAMLGLKTCEELGLVMINGSIQADSKGTTSATKPHEKRPLTKDKLIQDYKDCFEGIETFKMTPYHIILDPGAEPVVHPPRAVPAHLCEMFKAVVDNMEELGVIVPVNEPADWVNSVVLSETVNNNGEITKLRVCLDPRGLNKCIKREHYHMRTVDDVITELHNAKYFTVIDTTKGYWHVALDKESSLLTTFNTPFGKYRFTRMPLGLKVSQDIFQRELDSSLEGLTGVTGPERYQAFNEVKKEVSSLGVLRYFDPNAETVIETDASLKGLGAVLLQDGKPVCYASKALTETEQQYSNIEREALGVVWGLDRFHYFIYGKSCTIHTDHKPLEAILEKKLSNCPVILQSFVLRALSSNLKSPAELLNNRKLRTTLPMPKRVSVSDSTSKTKEELYHRQKLEACYYDKAAGPTLQPFRPAQPINIYDHHTKRWEQGTVVRPAKEPRSYIVKNDRTEGIYRRTRSQLKPRPKVKDNSIKDPPSSFPEKAASISQDSPTTPPQDGQTYTTRSGRTSKSPNRPDV
ncbi:Uncharacterized protein K02A2.6 [Stylophora pistillata]|uniref:Uncharacterized protein K02A2.6 n=1 Tax=Stylophora pistillata TaxID=50429 RepID=A0A2B4RIT7_STYPI|nr:Uncharacterized protein K02A2.6 [Stylophora pistillata]